MPERRLTGSLLGAFRSPLALLPSSRFSDGFAPPRIRLAAIEHPTQKFRDLDDGRLEMTLRVADTLEVRRWIFGFGSEAEIIEPATLREALSRDAEALARKLIHQRMPPAQAPVWPDDARRGTSRGRM